MCSPFLRGRVKSQVGRVRFFGGAKKRNPTKVLNEINVGLRYRAALDKLTRPTILIQTRKAK